MQSEVRILHLEDDRLDVELVRHLLRKEQLNARIDAVDTMEAFEQAIRRTDYALILCDFTIPGADAREVLALARRVWPDVPFIFLSGTLEEGLGVEMLKAGASDYVLKQRMGRLVPAIQRALHEREELARRQAAEQALRDAEFFYRQTLESIPGMVFTTRADGYCDYQSQQWVDYTGVPMSEHLGTGWNQLLHPDDRARAYAAWRDAVEGRAPYDLEYRVRRRDGQYEWFKVIARPIRDASGQVVRWFGVAADINELKQTERQLQELNATLEQRVAEQTAEVNRRAHQLQALTAQLTRVEQQERRRLAQVLHDHLQQLLVGAKFNLSMLQSQLPDRHLRDACRHVDNLLDESLAASRSLTAELSPTVLYKATFAAALRWLGEWMRDKHGLAVEVDADEQVDPQVEEVRVMLFQSVRELLFNVVKHARVSRASLRMYRDADRRIRISVADEGPGFDPGARGPSSGTSGLGLFAVGERLELLGGRLEIDSAPGQGARITLIAPPCLPGSPCPEAEMQPAAASTGTDVASPHAALDRRIRVLLADDHAVVRDGLARLLKTQPDVEVVAQAADGQEAINLAKALEPDIVVMDVSMPVLDGVEATRQLRRTMPDVCVIGLSMHMETAVATAMKQAGASTYLAKSSGPDMLIDAIRACRSGKFV